jgi:hypothetical protein
MVQACRGIPAIIGISDCASRWRESPRTLRWLPSSFVSPCLDTLESGGISYLVVEPFVSHCALFSAHKQTGSSHLYLSELKTSMESKGYDYSIHIARDAKKRSSTPWQACQEDRSS